jgi:hypothetical protein
VVDVVDVDVPVDPGARVAAPRRGPRRPLGPPLRRLDEVAVDQDAARFAELAGGGRRTPVGADDRGYVDVEAQQERLLHLHEAEVVDAAPPSVEDDDLQRRADAWWQRLCDNDPVVVRHRLEVAFADHGFGAAVLAVEAGVASVLLGVTSADTLVGRWQRRPGAERLTRLSAPDRHGLHAGMLRAGLVALTADALAVAPALREVRGALLQPDHPERRPAVLALAALPRPVVRSAEARDRFVREGAACVAGEEARARANPVGSAGALAPLDRDELVIRRILDTLEP